MILEAPPVECPVCFVRPVQAMRLRGGENLWRCRACGLGWWNWDRVDPAAFYDRSYFQSNSHAKGYDDYAALEPGVRRTARSRLRRLARLLKAGVARGPSPSVGARLLDVGCGTGVFLDEARARGWSASGVEVSAYAAEQARQRGLEVRCGPAGAGGASDGSLDCVTLWDVIEHLARPVDVLGECASALRPGGVLALSTGDLSSLCARLSGRAWHLFNLPEHLYFFTPLALQRALRRFGLRVAACVREVNWSPLRYLTERVGKTLTRPLPWLNRVAGDWLVPATLMDVIGLYAIKRRSAPEGVSG